MAKTLREGDVRVRTRTRGAVNATPARSDPIALRLDALRGVAAFAVVLGHSREKLQQLQPPRTSGLDTALLLPSAFAQEAVAVFFVLSGYLVGGQALRRAREGRFHWGEYLAKRLSRLWTVLLPGLLLTWLVDLLASKVRPGALAVMVRDSSSSTSTLLCNAVFLNPTRCTNYGSNDSLWSLSYEFWFYIVFAAAVWGFFSVRCRLWYRGFFGAVVAVFSTLMFGFSLIPHMAAWLMGVVVAELVARHGRPVVHRVPMFLALALLGAAMMFTSWAGLSKVWLECVVGVIASVLLYLLLVTSPRRRCVRAGRAAAWMGDWSFSMYVFHLPIVTLVLCLASPLLVTSNAWQVLSVYGVAFAATLISYVLSLFTERHTGLIRHYGLKLASMQSRRGG